MSQNHERTIILGKLRICFFFSLLSFLAWQILIADIIMIGIITIIDRDIRNRCHSRNRNAHTMTVIAIGIISQPTVMVIEVVTEVAPLIMTGENSRSILIKGEGKLAV